MTFTPGPQGWGHRSLCTWLSEQNLSSASACQHLYHLSLGNCGGIKFRLPELWLFLFLALKGVSVLHNRFPCIAPGHCLLSIESDKIGVPFHCWSVLQRSHGLTKRPWPDWRLVRTLACLEGRTLSCHRIATFSFDKVSHPPELCSWSCFGWDSSCVSPIISCHLSAVLLLSLWISKAIHSLFEATYAFSYWFLSLIGSHAVCDLTQNCS